MSLSKRKYGYFAINPKINGYKKALLSIELGQTLQNQIVRVTLFTFVVAVERDLLCHDQTEIYHLN